jgi:hypothetical protein
MYSIIITSNPQQSKSNYIDIHIMVPGTNQPTVILCICVFGEPPPSDQPS